jgi:hypothetical protein
MRIAFAVAKAGSPDTLDIALLTGGFVFATVVASMRRARAGRASQRRAPAAPRSAALTGSPLAHSNFRQRIWLPALTAVGLEGVHLHDLRHTGNQLTANAGANPRELMARMGHDSERAALVYLHSSRERQRALADAVGEAARAELAKSEKTKKAPPKGTRRARNRRPAAGGAV